MRQRLDIELAQRGLVVSRSQAESWIRMGKVFVGGTAVTKAGTMVSEQDTIELRTSQQYVSRAGLKLASVAQVLGIDFAGKTVVDVGSSTGGFTDYALQHGAAHIDAVDVGTQQLHPSLRDNPKIALFEKTDIRNFVPDEAPDIVVMDVSFISIRELLPHIASFCGTQTQLIVMLKPQFEAGRVQINKGVIKNDSIRRAIIRDFEQWAKKSFVIVSKADSDVHGAKGNRERFYLLKRSYN